MGWKGWVAATVVTGTAIALAAPALAPSQDPGSAWEIVVLGVAQDAGIPHLACQQALCESIRAGHRKAERVASIGVVNRLLGKAYLFDATPDFRSQVHSLGSGKPPDGIFLTHAHIGHYTGLMYLGRESIDAASVPVYGTERMSAFIRGNAPWSLLVTRRNIEVRTFLADQAIDLGGGLRVTAFTVPHRDEFTDTVGFLIEGPTKKAIFVPDIDRWQLWDRSIRDLADTVDYALVDGTFGSAEEIPGRTVDDIPHPMMGVTRDLLRGARAALWFIHVNHTNRQLDAADVVRDGQRFPL